MRKYRALKDQNEDERKVRDKIQDVVVRPSVRLDPRDWSIRVVWVGTRICHRTRTRFCFDFLLSSFELLESLIQRERSSKALVSQLWSTHRMKISFELVLLMVWQVIQNRTGWREREKKRLVPSNRRGGRENADDWPRNLSSCRSEVTNRSTLRYHYFSLCNLACTVRARPDCKKKIGRLGVRTRGQISRWAKKNQIWVEVSQPEWLENSPHHIQSVLRSRRLLLFPLQPFLLFVPL